MTKKSVTPAEELSLMITIVNAMNTAESVGVSLTSGPEMFESGRYTVTWDSDFDVWSLVAETDDAIHVCSLGHRTADMTADSECESCWNIAQTPMHSGS